MAVSPNPNDQTEGKVWYPPNSSRTAALYSAWSRSAAYTYHWRHNCPEILDGDSPNAVVRVSVEDERLSEAEPCDHCVE